MQHRGFSWGHGDQAVDLKQFAALEALANSRFWSFNTRHLEVQIMVSCRFSLNQSVERDSDLVIYMGLSQKYWNIWNPQVPVASHRCSLKNCWKCWVTQFLHHFQTHFWRRLCDRVPTPGFFMSIFGIFWWLRVFLINTRFQKGLLWINFHEAFRNWSVWHKLAVAKTERSVSRYLQGAKSVEKKTWSTRAFFCGRSFGDNPTPPQFWVVQLGQHRYALCSWFFLAERLKADQTLLSYNRLLQRQEFQAIHDRISWFNPLYIYIYI